MSARLLNELRSELAKPCKMAKGLEKFLEKIWGDRNNKPLQQNSWVNSGSGRSPRLWYRAVS